MLEPNFTTLRQKIRDEKLSDDQAFMACWQDLYQYICNNHLETIPTNIIDSYENICKGFKRYLISKNHAIIESQLTSTLTELVRKKYELQDNKKYRISATNSKSVIYIVKKIGKKSHQRIEKISSQILFATFDNINSESSDFIHFINIFKNCIRYEVNNQSESFEYTITAELYESFCTLFPDFLEQLKNISYRLYTKLLNEKEPYDKELRKIETQIKQKVDEVVKDRISWIICSGVRLQVVYNTTKTQ